MDRPDGSLRPETAVVALGRGPRQPGQPLNVPVILASNFRAASAPGEERSYAREDGTAGWDAFEEVVGHLEGGRALAFSSGLAAIDAALELLPIGGRVVVPVDYYSGARALLAQGAGTGRWQVTPVRATEPAQVLAALPGAAALWLESPSNPQLDIVDIAALAAQAHAHGVMVFADNTFATPLLQNPIALGVDVVVHSATKFMGGHSDLLMGALVTADDAIYESLRRRRTLGGAIPGALECFLALRGLRTLALRIERAQANATVLAHRLREHPAVARVTYPGLDDHPQAAIVRDQMRGGGAMLAFEVADADAADRVCAAVTVIESATSLGGVESCIERRSKWPQQEHLAPGLLRLSVGVEHVEDLWRDLAAALATATSNRP